MIGHRLNLSGPKCPDSVVINIPFSTSPLVWHWTCSVWSEGIERVSPGEYGQEFQSSESYCRGEHPPEDLELQALAKKTPMNQEDGAFLSKAWLPAFPLCKNTAPLSGHDTDVRRKDRGRRADELFKLSVLWETTFWWCSRRLCQFYSIYSLNFFTWAETCEDFLGTMTQESFRLYKSQVVSKFYCSLLGAGSWRGSLDAVPCILAWWDVDKKASSVLF